jgi:flagellar basal body P-ring formation protein FlgA
MSLRLPLCSLLLYACLRGSLAAATPSDGAPALLLLTNAQVDTEGIFLAQIVDAAAEPLPPVRLGDAPAFGQFLVLTRSHIAGLLLTQAPALASATWQGAERVRITRRAHTLTEAEMREQLTAVLQRDYVRDKGTLELRLLRSWLPMAVPDEPCRLKILDLPASGVSPNFIVRFQLVTPQEALGPWQVPVQARVWREIWVARSQLKGGQLLSEADVARERRDMLGLREPPFPGAELDQSLEIAETVPAGVPLYARAVRPRPVLLRGNLADARLQDGLMVISLKVEVLENGAPGQIVRVRNLSTKRELRGKVQNDQTVLVVL